MKRIFTKTLPLLALVMAVMLFPAPVLADTSPNGTYAVYVRVESNLQGSEKTLVPRTQIFFNDDEEHTPLEALEELLADFEVQTSEFGTYILGIDGVSDKTGSMAWMYAVNDALAWASADEYILKYGDEVVFYFVDWQADTQYAYFTPSAVTAEAGEAFPLTLMSAPFDGDPVPVADAALIITTTEDHKATPMPLNLLYTDEEGKVELTFHAAGTYYISARKSEPDGISVISRPYCEVTVNDGTAWEVSITETAQPDTPAIALENVLLEEITVTVEEPKLDEMVITVEGALVGSDIEDTRLIQPYTDADEWPVPELSAVVIPFMYNPETEEMWLYGEPFEPEEQLKPLYINDTLLLPVRAITNALGGEVDWDAKASSAYVSLNGYHFQFSLKDNPGGVPMAVVNDRAYIWADYYAEQLNLSSLIKMVE